MNDLPRITSDLRIMGGAPCIRGMRMPVSAVVGLVAAGHSTQEILALYPFLVEEDIRQALAYPAPRAGY